MKRQANPHRTSGSILQIVTSKCPPKSKQLDLSEDLKNAMPLPLLPTVITFFMLMGLMWQEAHKDGFLPPPKQKYSINFSQRLLNFSTSQKCFRIILNWNYNKNIKYHFYPKM